MSDREIASTQQPPRRRRTVEQKEHEGRGPQGGQGTGERLPGHLKSKFERSFATDLGTVRVHEDAGHHTGDDTIAAAHGSDIFVAPRAYRPGTVQGDMLLAHEVAHVVQQTGTGTTATGTTSDVASDASLEREATSAALAAMDNSTTPRLSRRSQGVGLQRCSLAELPMNAELLSTKEKADSVRQLIEDDDALMERAIHDVFKVSSSTGDFVQLQEQLDMESVYDELDAWTTVRIGTLGPVVSGVDVMNRRRKEIIWESTDLYGLARAQVITLWIFNSTQNDQIEEVLRLLAADRRLAKTIGSMPAVKTSLEARGIDLSKFPDRELQASDVARGMGSAVVDLLATAPIIADSRGQEYMTRSSQMPAAYSEVLSEIDAAEFWERFSYGNALYGSADYLTFGAISTVHGLVSGVVSGAKNIAKGELEDAAKDLLPALLVVGAAVGLRIRARRRAAAAEKAEGKAKGGAAPETMTVEEALARLEPESATALRKLIDRVGEADIKTAARYIEADSAAAALVHKHKDYGLRALIDAKGNVARAETLLAERVQVAKLPDGKTVPPSHHGGGFHGTSEVDPPTAFREGLPGSGTDVDLLGHAEQRGNSAFRGTTPTPMTPDGEGGAAHWAGDGGWVYEIKGVPTWDVNQLLEGRRQVGGGMGGFGGNLMHGELEGAVPRRVPPEAIKGAYPVVEGPGGRPRLGTYIENPSYQGKQ